MHRIDTTTRRVDMFGSGKDGFDDRDPPLGVPTHTSPAWMNSIQEELAAILEDSRTDLVKDLRDQVVRAIRRIVFDEAALDLRAVAVPTSTPRHVLDLVRLADGSYLGVGAANLLCASLDGVDWSAPPAGSLGTRENRAIAVSPGASAEAIVVVSDQGVYGALAGASGLVSDQTALASLNWSESFKQSYRAAVAGTSNVICVGDNGALSVIRPGTQHAGLATEEFRSAPTAAGGALADMTDVAASSRWTGAAWEPYLVAVGAGGYVIRSIDDGVTWERVEHGLTTVDLGAVAASGPHVVAGAHPDGALVSHDGGVTWVLVADTSVGSVVAPAPGGRFHTGEFVSRDGGATWLRIPSSTRVRSRIQPGASAATAIDPRHLVVFDGERWLVYATVSAGDPDEGSELVMVSRPSWGSGD